MPSSFAALKPADREDYQAHKVRLGYPPERARRDAGDTREPPRVPLAESYRDQTYRFALGDRLVELAAAPDGPVEGVFPRRDPVHLVTAWNPPGPARTLRENLDATTALTARLERQGHRVLLTSVRSGDGDWLEQWLGVPGLTDDDAVDLAHGIGQPTAIRWDTGTLALLPTGILPLQPATWSWRLRDVAHRTCPMRTDTGAGRCRAEGGPWVSRSMEVGTVWLAHRDLALWLRGCDTCADADPAPGQAGTPIPLVHLLLASRHGGYAFGGYLPEPGTTP